MADNTGYEDMASRMVELARQQDGFLGMDSAREEVGITVCYWRDLECIRKWKANSEHLIAQEEGKGKWYKSHRIRIARVDFDYGG